MKPANVEWEESLTRGLSDWPAHCQFQFHDNFPFSSQDSRALQRGMRAEIPGASRGYLRQERISFDAFEGASPSHPNLGRKSSLVIDETRSQNIINLLRFLYGYKIPLSTLINRW